MSRRTWPRTSENQTQAPPLPKLQDSSPEPAPVTVPRIDPVVLAQAKVEAAMRTLADANAALISARAELSLAQMQAEAEARAREAEEKRKAMERVKNPARVQVFKVVDLGPRQQVMRQTVIGADGQPVGSGKESYRFTNVWMNGSSCAFRLGQEVRLNVYGWDNIKRIEGQGIVLAPLE